MVILVSLLGVLHWNLAEFKTLADGFTRTEAIERELRAMREDMIDAETGQRGFLLTQNPAYLEPYENATATLLTRFRSLHGLVEDAHAQDLLARMHPVAEARIELLSRTIRLTHDGRHAEALRIVHEGTSKALMDQFRRLNDQAIQRELELLAALRSNFLRQFDQVLISSVLGGLAALALLWFTALRTARRVAGPVHALLHGIEATTAGDLRHQVAVTDHDEIGRIAEAFNHMSERLRLAQDERDAALRELQRSNAELDNFAYVASHDLKAPLRGIRNLTEWIAEDVRATASEDTHDNLRLLHNRVDRLDSLLESLLTYSRVGRQNGHAETVDLGRLVGEIRDYLAPRPGFTVSCSADMPVLTTNKAPLEQVLRNLINNALKHHDRDTGRVTVSATPSGEFVEFRVEDDGPGIAPEFHERIFQMFQTLKPRDQVEGSGMGLAIVRKTIEGFGGTIRVESAPPRRGSCFVFTWPTHVEGVC
ncbi:CHASE3 domain-containing protein [Thauera sp. CAU 1555]|uniref:histidine kinase n=1 Tax=Thauera sedimentorum TaxID=2767595 RepID=A0ABR9BCM8_9RHOO|nr:CHASE3 domain-containing protein [Thauera sedimentorum]MBC9072067.1 CHASE3 domain-containing protein [Thauera sedimentorum]MBD8502986.1 CHASE3 domain-containing protein [Thauera sedimentorum]